MIASSSSVAERDAMGFMGRLSRRVNSRMIRKLFLPARFKLVIPLKKVLETLLKARDLNYYRGITDCGAGGLSSAVGEMGKDTGARVYLDKVPLKYQGLSYTEIWISESQERMVLAVPPSTIEKLLAVCAG